MGERIYPYKTISGDLRLDIKNILLDGADPYPDPFDRDSRQINFCYQENTNWNTAAFKIELQGPGEELRGLPNSETVAATVVIHCDLSRQRYAVSMRRAGVDAGRWTALVELEREDYRGIAKLEAVVTGTAGGLPNRLLGASPLWTLNFDEPSVSPKTGAIEVKWVDFKSPDAQPFLKDYANESFYADLVDEKPVVYLNKSKDFEKLPVILDDRRRDKRDLALHNSERTGIARSVWIAMLNASIAGIQEGDDGADPDWPELGWQRQVLKTLLPRIYHPQSDAEALKTAFESWSSRQGAGLLQSRGQAEINRRIGAAKLLRRTLNLLGSAEEVRDE